MKENDDSKQYDLEERTFKFAEKIMVYVDGLPKTISNIEIGKQLARAGGSVGANYIEAIEALSKKDFVMRIKISRKESKESRYWLKLSKPQEEYIKDRKHLVQESTEFLKIFSSMLRNLK